MPWTDNPLRDFERYDEERERILNSMPICCNCGEHTQGEFRYELPNGEVLCERCIDGFRVSNDSEV